MLGSNPLNDPNSTLQNTATGGPGFIMGSMAQVAKGIQGLMVAAPGFVPPEILMWMQNAMQQLPDLINKQQGMTSPAGPAAGTPPPGGQMPMMPQAPQAPTPGGGVGVQGAGVM